MTNKTIENPFCDGEYYVSEYRKSGKYHRPVQMRLTGVKKFIDVKEYRYECPACERALYVTHDLELQ